MALGISKNFGKFGGVAGRMIRATKTPSIGDTNRTGSTFKGKYQMGAPVWERTLPRGVAGGGMGGGGGAEPAANALFKDIYGRAMAGLGASGVAASSSAVHGAVGASVAAQELVLNERSRRAQENLQAYGARTQRQGMRAQTEQGWQSIDDAYTQWQKTFDENKNESVRQRLYDSMNPKDQARWAWKEYNERFGKGPF